MGVPHDGVKPRPELDFFASLAYFSEAKTVVEIGVAYGDGTYHLCKGVERNGGCVYGFDIWAKHGLKSQFNAFGSKEFVEAKLRKNGVTNFFLTQVDSINARKDVESCLDKLCPNGIDLAFIDGDHSYLGVANDFAIIYPRLTPRGIVVFHDTLIIDGCREFMLDLRTKYYDGTYDVVNFTAGRQKAVRVGIGLVIKRDFATDDTPIIEVCGSPSLPHEIERREVEWAVQEIIQAKATPIQIEGTGRHLDKVGSYNRKKFEVI